MSVASKFLLEISLEGHDPDIVAEVIKNIQREAARLDGRSVTKEEAKPDGEYKFSKGDTVEIGALWNMDHPSGLLVAAPMRELVGHVGTVTEAFKRNGYNCYVVHVDIAPTSWTFLETSLREVDVDLDCRYPRGSKVKVLGPWEPKGESPVWMPKMDDTVGKVGLVADEDSIWVRVNVPGQDRTWSYRPEVLQLLDDDYPMEEEEDTTCTSEPTQSFKRGDKVKVLRKFPKDERPHWNQEMDKTVGMVGTVNYVWDDDPEIVGVKFEDGADWNYQVQVLQKVEVTPKEKPAKIEDAEFRIGDIVRITDSFSDDIGPGWNDEMDDTVGQCGKITDLMEVRGEKCARVEFDDYEDWAYLLSVLEKATKTDLNPSKYPFKTGQKVKFTKDWEDDDYPFLGGPDEDDLDYIGRSATIIEVDSDGTSRVEFSDGYRLWVPNECLEARDSESVEDPEETPVQQAEFREGDAVTFHKAWTKSDCDACFYTPQVGKCMGLVGHIDEVDSDGSAYVKFGDGKDWWIPLCILEHVWQEKESREEAVELKIGDKVRVARRWTEEESSLYWNPKMHETIGREGTITGKDTAENGEIRYTVSFEGLSHLFDTWCPHYVSCVLTKLD